MFPNTQKSQNSKEYRQKGRMWKRRLLLKTWEFVENSYYFNKEYWKSQTATTDRSLEPGATPSLTVSDNFPLDVPHLFVENSYYFNKEYWKSQTATTDRSLEPGATPSLTLSDNFPLDVPQL